MSLFLFLFVPSASTPYISSVPSHPTHATAHCHQPQPSYDSTTTSPVAPLLAYQPQPLSSSPPSASPLSDPRLVTSHLSSHRLTPLHDPSPPHSSPPLLRLSQHPLNQHRSDQHLPAPQHPSLHLSSLTRTPHLAASDQRRPAPPRTASNSTCSKPPASTLSQPPSTDHRTRLHQPRLNLPSPPATSRSSPSPQHPNQPPPPALPELQPPHQPAP